MLDYRNKGEAKITSHKGMLIDYTTGRITWKRVTSFPTAMLSSHTCLSLLLAAGTAALSVVCQVISFYPIYGMSVVSA